MSDSNKKKISNETLLKCMALSSEILLMHGSVVGGRVCQDWSGNEEFNPEKLFTKSELQDIAYNYEVGNSQLDDYCPEYHGMHDEMMVSFAMSDALKQAANLIEQQQQRIAELEDQVPKWVKLEDDLPKYGVPVLLKIQGIVQEVTYMRDGSDVSLDWFEPFHYEDEECVIFISHDAEIEWLPLPPKGE